MTDNTINNDMTMGGATGTLLAGRYRVVRQLGQGGMGSVWLAEDTKLDGFKVAIKMLPSVLVNNKRAYAQVKAEALVSLKLSHPNIATVRAFEEESGSPFLVMDYIDGQTLDDYLAEKGKLTEEETVKLLKPVAAALDYAHAQGVVHRDVKPGNIMIRKDGTPFVLDFGIAREIQETMTRVTGKLSSGTLLYMSPEQLNGDAPKPAQDIYSFAAMAYECLKGEPPFSRGGVEDQIKHKTPEALGPQFIKCGPGVMAGLAKSPEARPATCASVLSVGPRIPRDCADDRLPARGTRIAAVLLGALALAALVGVGVWWWQERTKTERQREEMAAVAPSVVTQVVEKVVEKPVESVAHVVDEEADRRHRDEIAKLEKLRTKVAIRIAATKDDYAKVESYRSERDGFETHLAEIDRQWKMLTEVQSPNTLAEAELTMKVVTEAADAIAFELNWLEKNREGRDAAKRIETEIAGELEKQLREFKAHEVAKSKYDKGQKERRTAAEALAGGEFASARHQYEVAKATLTAALAEARQFLIKTTLEAANEYKNAAQWQNCRDEAEKVLGWDPKNADALALKDEASRHLEPQAGDSMTITLPGGATMDFCWCPATTSAEWKKISGGKEYFLMGSPVTEEGRDSDEMQHRVTLTKGFWMGKYEVTQAQWESVMGENPSRFKSSDRPVEQVSWEDCQQFIQKINAEGRVTVSLPTEAQWEYACRAGTATSLPNGKTLHRLSGYNGPALDEIAWYGGNSSVGFELSNGRDVSDFDEKQYPGSKAGTHPVGQKKPNGWGLYDMIGNVGEWCSDWYDKDYYEQSPASNPPGSDWGAFLVFRGGCWYSLVDSCRSADRDRMGPDFGNLGRGLRLVCLSRSEQLREGRLSKMRGAAKVSDRNYSSKKTLSNDEIMKLLNKGSKKSVEPTADELQSFVRIKEAFESVWNRPPWSDALRPMTIRVWFGDEGRVANYRLEASSGNQNADSTIVAAAEKVGAVPGLSKAFLDKYKSSGVPIRFTVKPN